MTIKISNPQPVFRTADLALTAALCVTGFIINEIEKNNSNRVVFLFSQTPQLQETISMYWSGKLSVNPLTYFNELKTLKSRIYER